MRRLAISLLAGVLGGVSAVILKAGGFSFFIPAGIVQLVSVALFLFALSKEEAVLVAPLVGTASTLTTLAGGALLFGEVLNAKKLVAVAFLMAGGALLSGKR